MAVGMLSGADRARCLIALIGAVAVVSTTSSLAWPILAEALRNQGWNETMIGLNSAAQFAGIALVALVVTPIVRRWGFYRTMMTGLVVAAAMLVLLPTWRDYHVWAACRLLLGMGNSLLFTAGDTWVNVVVADRVRGRWLGIYTTAGMAGWAVGPFLGSLLDADGTWPFLIGVAAIGIAMLALLPTRAIDLGLAPSPARGSTPGLLPAVFVAAPTVLLASAVFGLVEGGVQSFAHLYTMDLLGAEYRGVGFAVIWVASLGAIFFQYPVGWLADRVDRGWLLVGCVALLLVTIALLPFLISAGAGPWWAPRGLALWGSLVLWGAAMGGVFTVAMTLLGERFRGLELVAANAVFALLFGLGGMIGPLGVGAAMERFGPQGFPGLLCATVLAYVLFAAWRRWLRRQAAAED